MNVNIEGNENWGVCPKCGEPVLRNAETGVAEPCANCESEASPEGGALGMGAIAVGVIAIAAVLYLCIKLLL